MSPKIPKIGGGQFQWNTGGWFGAQLGGTAWMVILGVMLAFRAPVPGLAALTVALGVNLVGTWMWVRRNRLEPYPAIQALLGVVALGTLLLLLAFDATGRLADVDPRFQRNPRGVYFILLMFPLLMAMFHFQNKVAKKK